MKIRRSVLWLTIAALVLIAVVLWHGRGQLSKTPASVPTETNSTSAATQHVANKSSQPNRATSVAATQNNATGTGKPGVVKWQSLNPSNRINMLKAMLQANDADIVFYGKLEDQFSNGVSDAKVSFGIQYRNDKGSGMYRGQVVSDANGYFTISGYKGENLGIMPDKTGYVLATTGTEFRYSQLEPGYFVPDPNNPVVIKMWKQQGGEHLVSFNIKASIPVDGSPQGFNLHTGREIQKGGDLIIRLQSASKPSVRNQYDWKASMQIADGGIIQDTNGLGLEKMFEAPSSGYTPEFELISDKGTQQWSPRFIGGVYFTGHGGQIYGKMIIQILTDVVKNGRIPIMINGYLNPAGSRNLEIDPKLVTEAHP